MTTEEIGYEVTRISLDDRIASIRGWYKVVARCNGFSDFSIDQSEAEAKRKATQRLRYRMKGFT